MDQYSFQYCPKLVLFSEDETKVLLCKRKGENDYDGVFSFAGGKMEITDSDFVDGIAREKCEEIGDRCKVLLYPAYNANVLFRKKDGSTMITSHYYAKFAGGDIVLNDEYSEYKWVPISEIDKFEPKIPTIPTFVKKMQELRKIINDDDLVEI